MGGPGRSYRAGLTIAQAVEFFSDPEFTERWFIEQRWPNGVRCPRCGADDVQHRPTRKPQPFRCRACRMDFSVKTRTLMHSSPLPLKAWGLALYLLTTNQKGVSSMKLHRDLGVTQKTAWHLAHRIRAAWGLGHEPFGGTIEVDETFIGGKEGNKHANRKRRAGRGGVGKTAVVGMKARAGHQVYAVPVARTDAATLHTVIEDHTTEDAFIVTDEHGAYNDLPRRHETVRHSAGEYVRGRVSTNGIESFWALLKRGYMGTYHWWSVKHMARYVREFAGRYNRRGDDTVDQMQALARGLDGKRLPYSVLIA